MRRLLAAFALIAAVCSSAQAQSVVGSGVTGDDKVSGGGGCSGLPLPLIAAPVGPAASNTPLGSTTRSVPSGSTILVAVDIQAATNQAFVSLSDPTANSYLIAQPTAAVGVLNNALIYSINIPNTIAPGSAFTVTTGGGTWNLDGAWITCTTGGLDVAAVTSSATSGTGVTLNSGATAASAVTAFGYLYPNASRTITTGTGFSALLNSGTADDIAYEAQSGSTASISYNPTWTGGTAAYSAVLLVFDALPSYAGPGNVTGSWLRWHGLRAFSSATRGNALVNVCNSTGGADVGCADLSSDPITGNLVGATIAGISCPGTNCTVKSWYDQIAGGVTLTQNTVSARATLDANCIGTLPCATGVDIVNGIYSNATGVTASVPWSINSVAFLVSGSNSTNQSLVLQAAPNNERLQTTETTNAVGFACSATAVTQTVTLNNWFALSGVCNGASGIFALNTSTFTSQNAGSDALSSAGTYSLMRKMVGKFVEGGINSTGFSTGTITSLHSNQKTYWGF